MPQSEGEIHILVGLTGSVASVKAPILVEQLRVLDIPAHTVQVEVITTKHAKHFYTLPDDVTVWDDEEEWSSWKKIPDPVLHIELRKWADILVIAPLDANTMAKICTGICDNLVTCVVRAWDLDRPLLFAPAMNTFMYNHPLTGRQIGELKETGYIEIASIAKKLACGDTGLGAMAEVGTIVACVEAQILSRVIKRTWKSC